MEAKACSTEEKSSSISLCDVSSSKSLCADQSEEVIHHQEVVLVYMFSNTQLILMKFIIDVQ